MNGTYLLILVVVIASAAGTKHARIARSVPPTAARFGIPLVCITLCALFALQLAVIATSAWSEPSLSVQLRQQLPIVPQEAGFLYRGQVANSDAVALDALKAAQAVALLVMAVLVASTGGNARTRASAWIAVSAVTLAALAFLAPATESADLYSYAGLAQTANPYHPSAAPLAGDMAVVNKIWGLPLAPSPYGPLWLALTKIILTPLPALAPKLFALRALDAVVLAICLALLALGKRSPVLLALVAVNPAIYDLFLAEGHNDLLGVACILGAAALRSRAPLLAVLLAACAGLIKLPYALIAPLAFVAEPILLRRVAYGLSSIALTVAVTVAAGGSAYWLALQRVHDLYATPPTPIELAIHVSVAIAAAGAIVAGVLVRRFTPGGALLFIGLGPIALPWYLAWGFPYALLAGKPDVVFLAMLPIASLLLNTGNPATAVFYAAWLSVAGSALFVIVESVRRGRRRRAAHAEAPLP